MAGLDLPGATPVPDRSADLLRIMVAVAFLVGGIGGIAVLLRYRPPMQAA